MSFVRIHYQEDHAATASHAQKLQININVYIAPTGSTMNRLRRHRRDGKVINSHYLRLEVVYLRRYRAKS